jgi:hypothetical protein
MAQKYSNVPARVKVTLKDGGGALGSGSPSSAGMRLRNPVPSYVAFVCPGGRLAKNNCGLRMRVPASVPGTSNLGSG